MSEWVREKRPKKGDRLTNMDQNNIEAEPLTEVGWEARLKALQTEIASAGAGDGAGTEASDPHPFTESFEGWVPKEPKEGKKFELQNQFLTLTYGNKATGDVCIDKKAYLEWFGKLGDLLRINVPKPVFIRLAHEHYKDGRIHTHVLIDWGRAYKIYNPRLFDILFNGVIVHPWMGGLRGRSHFNTFRKYLGKEDLENKDLLVDVNEASAALAKIAEAKDVHEALGAATKISHITGIIAAHKAIGKKYQLPASRWRLEDFEVRTWHTQVCELMASTHYRKLIWIFDPVGNLGKTWFCKWLKHQPAFGKKVLSLDIKDQKTGFGNLFMAEAERQEWEGGYVMVKVPKAASDTDEFYTALENISDGEITTGLYERRSVETCESLAVVLANTLPRLAKSLSLDRFMVFECTLKSPELRPMTLDEVSERRKIEAHSRAAEKAAENGYGSGKAPNIIGAFPGTTGMPGLAETLARHLRKDGDP